VRDYSARAAETSTWRLASLSHTYTDATWIRWWGPNDGGYVDNLDEAGAYELPRLLDRSAYYGAWDLLVVPDYVARRLARVSPSAGRVRNAAKSWGTLRLVALFEHVEPHPNPIRRRAL
jgi:hypothetical protein